MASGPKLSFAQLYDAHVDEVYRYVHRRCQDHSLAEDVTQDTFMTAIRTVEDPSTISIGWLITVARNKLFDVFRRQLTHEEKLQLVANDPAGASEIDIAERLRVEAALGVLPMHYRLVLTLHYINGMTVRDIATELDKSLKSVEGLITRARRELAAALEADETDPSRGGDL
ncbi:MAG: sigma-70 family RNA polymerase sigma factor [Actinomycetota bacterium]